MKVHTLAFKDGHGREQAIHACGQCGQWYPDHINKAARDEAEECCTDIVHHCEVCGEPLVRRVYVRRRLCAEHKDRERRLATLEKAEIVPPTAAMYTDPDGDEFFSDPAAWIEDGETADLYCHPCSPAPFSLNINNALDCELDEHYEGAADEIVDERELQEFVRAWNKKQTLVSYYPIMGQIVLLDPNFQTRSAMTAEQKRRWAEADANGEPAR